MKKHLIAFMLLSATVVLFYACKKEIKQQKQEEEISGQDFSMNQVETGVSVSNYGFLQFESREVFTEYREYVLANTHEQVQRYLEDLGFNSLGAEKFGQDYMEDTVTNEQLSNYFFRADSIIQVENVLFKVLTDAEFLLAMRSDNFNNMTYEYLAAGIYDSSTMNKFSSIPDNQEEWDLIDYVDQNPNGHEDTQPNTANKRFWGWNDLDSWTANCPGQEHCSCIFTYQRKSVFWFWTSQYQTVYEVVVCSE